MQFELNEKYKSIPYEKYYYYYYRNIVIVYFANQKVILFTDDRNFAHRSELDIFDVCKRWKDEDFAHISKKYLFAKHALKSASSSCRAVLRTSIYDRCFHIVYGLHFSNMRQCHVTYISDMVTTMMLVFKLINVTCSWSTEE